MRPAIGTAAEPLSLRRRAQQSNHRPGGNAESHHDLREEKMAARGNAAISGEESVTTSERTGLANARSIKGPAQRQGLLNAPRA